MYVGSQCICIGEEREGMLEGFTRLREEKREDLGYGQQEEIEGYAVSDLGERTRGPGSPFFWHR